MNRTHLAATLGFALLLCPTAARPQSLSLDGQWEMHWAQTDAVPDQGAEWQAATVPSLNRQKQGHPFAWYRRSFALPDEFKGKRLFLRFGGVRFVSVVYLNGKEVGGHYGGWEPFEIDVTKACRAREPNALLVRVQDVTGVIDQDLDAAKGRGGGRFVDRAKDSIMAPVGSRYFQVDIWQPVSLVARNGVYVQDVFVKTSVRNKQIEADFTLRNLSDVARDVRLTSNVAETDVALGTMSAKLRPGASQTLTLKQPWPNPRLWGPEDPHLYHLATTVSEAGRELDALDTRFGFREFWTDGIYLVLNGTRMKFLATAGHPRGELDGKLSKAGAKDFYSRIREAGCVAMRLHANIWPEWWYEAADEVGMPLIMESALFGYFKSYALSKPKFWDNYHKHLEAVVKHKRNHPAVVMYSLENEILHCGGDKIEGTVHRLADAGRFLKKLDPTRPIMYDADHDPEGVADVVNLHYPLDFSKSNLWPDVAYWLETGAVLCSWPKEFWQWDRKKPLYFGEFLHIQHYTEADPYSTLIGDKAYVDHGLAMGRAKGLAWQMQIEAYRAAELSGMCPWTLTETGDFPNDENPRYVAVKRAYQKNAAFVREYDTRFYENETVARTVYVYNDTLHPAQLAFMWELKAGERIVDRGEQRLEASPAQRFKLKIDLKMPPAPTRTPLTLALKVLNNGKPAFEESKQYWVFPRRKLSLPADRRIAVFEAADRALSARLTQAGAHLLRVDDLAKLPDADILVIGPHALDALSPEAGGFVVGAESSVRDALADFVRSGGSVLALEQGSYDCKVLPGDLFERGCTIAFQRTRHEQIFRGATDTDFRFWRGDHVVCRKTIVKPQHGRFRALVDSGGPAGLVYLAACEIMEGTGKFVLSQLAICEKLDSEPVAQLMLENLMAYAASRPAPAAALALVQDKLPMRDALNEIDARFTDLSGKLPGADLAAFGVLLAEADCPEVEQNQANIRAFVQNGGKVILHRGTKAGLPKIQKLFPEPIVAQPSNAVPVVIAAWDPVINGLTNQELYWYGSRKGLHWRVRTPLAADVCRHVIAAGLPDPAQCITVEAESMAVADRSPSIGKEDVYMGSTATIGKTLEFARTGDYAIAVRARGTPLGGVYPQVRILLDGKRCGSITADGEKWDTYSIMASVAAGQHEIRLSFVNDAWAPEKGEDRNVWIDKVVYGPAPSLKSKRILSPAALVRVPLGKGFYLLDQVEWTGQASSSEKAGRYLSNILTNLNCPFGPHAGGTLITGDKLTPEDNLRLHKARGGAAYLGGNGTVYASVRFGKTRLYQFAIKASGTEAGGEFPNIDLSIDGDKIGSAQLRRSGWQIMRLEAEVEAGEHKVALSFTNDFYDPPEDRNLRIGHMEIK